MQRWVTKRRRLILCQCTETMKGINIFFLFILNKVIYKVTSKGVVETRAFLLTRLACIPNFVCCEQFVLGKTLWVYQIKSLKVTAGLDIRSFLDLAELSCKEQE